MTSNVTFSYLNNQSESTPAVELSDMDARPNSKLINKVGFQARTQ